MMRGREIGGIDSGALLREAYRFCERPPGEAALLPWAKAAEAFARALDEEASSPPLHASFEELCALVDTHPASFAAAAPWAEERLEALGAEAGDRALLLLDALASAPERAAMDDEALDLPGPALDELLASLPPEGLEAADAAIRSARAWQAEVRQLFGRAEREARRPGIAVAALDGAPVEEDYVLLCRVAEGELVLTRNEATVFVDWYGRGEPELSVGGATLEPRPLPQGQGRRWPLPARARPYELRLELGPLAHSIELPGAE